MRRANHRFWAIRPALKARHNSAQGKPGFAGAALGHGEEKGRRARCARVGVPARPRAPRALDRGRPPTQGGVAPLLAPGYGIARLQREKDAHPRVGCARKPRRVSDRSGAWRSPECWDSLNDLSADPGLRPRARRSRRVRRFPGPRPWCVCRAGVPYGTRCRA